MIKGTSEKSTLKHSNNSIAQVEEKSNIYNFYLKITLWKP